jgi:hypothetical protein
MRDVLHHSSRCKAPCGAIRDPLPAADDSFLDRDVNAQWSALLEQVSSCRPERSTASSMSASGLLVSMPSPIVTNATPRESVRPCRSTMTEGFSRVSHREIGSTRRVRLGPEINLVVRTAGDPTAIAGSIRSVVRDLDRDAPVHDIDVLSSELNATAAQPRFTTAVLTAFAALALGLAAVGLYGVLSYGVSRRRNELAIRAALGATRAVLVRLVLREGLSVTAIGFIFGAVTAFASVRVMRTVVFGITRIDPLSFLLAAFVVVVVSILACAVPARRASSLDPNNALRSR